MYDLIIKQGNVALRNGVKVVDIGIKEGKISCIAEQIMGRSKEIIDASGQYVLPGMIDTHVHISEPGRTEFEGYETGSKALAAGGTTCYVEMPLHGLPATTNRKVVELKKEIAKNKNYVDYSFYGGLVPGNLEELEEQANSGVLAFKSFISSTGGENEEDFKNVDDYTLYKGMEKIAELGKILCVHAENESITKKSAQEKIAQGKTTVMDYVDSRPIFVEVEAVQKVLLFAKETGCRVHFVHISSQEAVEIIIKAREEGVDVSLESCVHYFAISAEEFEKIGNKAKCAPPLRKIKDQERLWKQLLKGNIDWITSDHAPCTEDLKKGNVFEAWAGINGCQNNVDIMFDLAVKKRGMSISKFIDLISIAPAKRFNLPDKGEISVGKDADIILLNSNTSYTLKKEDLYYKNKFSPYENRKIDCRITKTIVRGNTVYDLERGIIEKPIGKLITSID